MTSKSPPWVTVHEGNILLAERPGQAVITATLGKLSGTALVIAKGPTKLETFQSPPGTMPDVYQRIVRKGDPPIQVEAIRDWWEPPQDRHRPRTRHFPLTPEEKAHIVITNDNPSAVTVSKEWTVYPTGTGRARISLHDGLQTLGETTISSSPPNWNTSSSCTVPTENDPETSYNAEQYKVAFSGHLGNQRRAEQTALDHNAVVISSPIPPWRKEYTFRFPCPAVTQKELLQTITNTKEKLEEYHFITYVAPVTVPTPGQQPTSKPPTIHSTEPLTPKANLGELTTPSTPRPRQGDHIVRIQAHPSHITASPVQRAEISEVQVYYADGTVENLPTGHHDLVYNIENPDPKWGARTKLTPSSEPQPDPPILQTINSHQTDPSIIIPIHAPTTSLYRTVSYLGHTSQTRVDVRQNPGPGAANTCGKTTGNTGHIMLEFGHDAPYSPTLAGYAARDLNGHVKAWHPAAQSFEITFPCQTPEDMEQALKTVHPSVDLIKISPHLPTDGDAHNTPTGLVVNLEDRALYVQHLKSRKIGPIRLAMSNGSITSLDKHQLIPLLDRISDTNLATVDPETWTVHGLKPGVTTLYLKHPLDRTQDGARITINVIHQTNTGEKLPKLIYLAPLPIKNKIMARPGDTISLIAVKVHHDTTSNSIHPQREAIVFESPNLPEGIDELGNVYIPHNFLEGHSDKEIEVRAHHGGMTARKTIVVIPHNTSMPKVNEDCTYTPPTGAPPRKANILAIRPTSSQGPHNVGTKISGLIDSSTIQLLGTQVDPIEGETLTIIKIECDNKPDFDTMTELIEEWGLASIPKLLHQHPETNLLTGISISVSRQHFTNSLINFEMETHHQGGYHLQATPQRKSKVNIVSADPSVVTVKNGGQAITNSKAAATVLTFHYMGQEDTKEITVIPPSLDRDCRLWTQAGYMDVEDIYYDIKGTHLTSAELTLTKGLGRPMARRIARTARATLKEGHQGNIHAPVYTLNIKGIECSARGLTDSTTILRLLSKWENEGKTDHNIHSLKTRKQTLTFHTRVWTPREDTWLPRLRYGQNEPGTKITGIESHILNESPIFPLQYLEIIHASIYENRGTIRMQPQDTKRLFITARDPGILKPADDAAHKTGQKVQHDPSQYALGKNFIQAIRPGKTELTIRLDDLETTLPVTISAPAEAHPEHAVHCTRTTEGITVAADQAIVRTKTSKEEARVAAFAAHSQGAIIKVSPDNRTYLLQLQCLPELVQPPTTPEFWQVESAHPHIIAIDGIPVTKGHNPDWQPSPPNLINKEMSCNHNLKRRISPKFLAFDQQNKQHPLAVRIEKGIEQVTKSTMHSDCRETGLAAPKLHRPKPEQPGTCLAPDSTLKAENLPPGLKAPGGGPTPDHRIDQQGNAIIHWAPDARPPGNARCWVYVPETGWKTYN